MKARGLLLPLLLIILDCRTQTATALGTARAALFKKRRLRFSRDRIESNRRLRTRLCKLSKKVIMNIGKCAQVLVIVALVSNSLQAAVIPGRWEKVAILPQDTHIVLFLRSADQIEGTYQGLSDGYLLVYDLSGSEVRLPQSAIEKVAAAKPVADSLWNGPLIGLGIGAGSGALLGATLYREEGFPTIFSRGETAAITAVAGAAIGLTIGLVTDVLNKSPEVLYVAINDNHSE